MRSAAGYRQLKSTRLSRSGRKATFADREGVMSPTREDALAIWRAAVAAADPFESVRAFLAAADSPVRQVLAADGRVLVCGGGKAGSLMAAAIEAALAGMLGRVRGLVNVPGGTERQLESIETRAAPPARSNH